VRLGNKSGMSGGILVSGIHQHNDHRTSCSHGKETETIEGRCIYGRNKHKKSGFVVVAGHVSPLETKHTYL